VEAAAVERAFIEVDGPDADTYLQGQLSQDIGAGGGLSFLLDPGGKVVSLLRFGRDGGGGGYLLDTDVEAGEATLARLRRFLLRTKVEIEPVADRRLVRIFGGPRLPQAQIVTAWSPDDAVQDVVEPIAGDLDATMAPAEYHRRRILAGVPVAGVDIGPETIPAEVGAWAIEAAVSFTKGCYTGQELVARIDSRGGNVPRPLRVLRFEGDVDAGAEVLGPDGQPAGRITSASGELALAPIARRVEPGAAVHAAGVAGIVER
jgi:tRNA-modifying protein YgfZ